MTGTYQNIDGSIYEVFFEEIKEGKKRGAVLMARCTKSLTKTNKPFPIEEGDFDKGIKHGSWVKIN